MAGNLALSILVCLTTSVDLGMAVWGGEGLILPLAAGLGLSSASRQSVSIPQDPAAAVGGTGAPAVAEARKIGYFGSG